MIVHTMYSIYIQVSRLVVLYLYRARGTVSTQIHRDTGVVRRMLLLRISYFDVYNIYIRSAVLHKTVLLCFRAWRFRVGCAVSRNIVVEFAV